MTHFLCSCFVTVILYTFPMCLLNKLHEIRSDTTIYLYTIIMTKFIWRACITVLIKNQLCIVLWRSDIRCACLSVICVINERGAPLCLSECNASDVIPDTLSTDKCSSNSIRFLSDFTVTLGNTSAAWKADTSQWNWSCNPFVTFRCIYCVAIWDHSLSDASLKFLTCAHSHLHTTNWRFQELVWGERNSRDMKAQSSKRDRVLNKAKSNTRMLYVTDVSQSRQWEWQASLFVEL